MGSSASTSAGRCASARATATRCISPPDSSRGKLSARSREAHGLEQLASRADSPRGPPRRSARAASRRCARRSGAAAGGTPGTRSPCACDAPGCARSRRAARGRALRAAARPVRDIETGDQVQQRRLADAGLADDRDVLARLHGERHAVEHAAASRAAEGLRQRCGCRACRALIHVMAHPAHDGRDVAA